MRQQSCFSIQYNCFKYTSNFVIHNIEKRWLKGSRIFWGGSRFNKLNLFMSPRTFWSKLAYFLKTEFIVLKHSSTTIVWCHNNDPCGVMRSFPQQCFCIISANVNTRQRKTVSYYDKNCYGLTGHIRVHRLYSEKHCTTNSFGQEVHLLYTKMPCHNKSVNSEWRNVLWKNISKMSKYQKITVKAKEATVLF